jgi:pimeloyl-ACP methyl ester carboxylesterase
MGAAADLFSTGLAADDMAAVIQALALGVVDLYGDSYGTYFSQAFAGRHPEMLRSVVLDAAYAVTGADPWYPEAPLAAANAFDQSCRRSPACQELPGTSMSRIQALLGAVRANPVTAVAPNGDGTPSLVHANAQGLAYAMFSNASLVVYRELDAAARAWTDHMDQAPFLRLIAENQEAARSLPGNLDTTAFSAGLFVAVSCSDYPQIYSMTLGLEERLAQDAMVIRQKRADDPNVFAPFTIDEFLQMPLDYSVVNLCLRWPVPSLQYPPGQPVPPGTVFPGVPVLVLSGDLDSLTPVAQGAQAAALFPNASQVITANTGHVSALADPYRCASTIVRNFVQALSAGDTSCAALIPEVRLVPQFARTAGELDPASALPGNRGSAAELQVVSAAVLTAGDAMARWWVNYDRSGVGLRGGSFRYVPAGTHERFDLAGLQWTEEVAVSGSIDWDLLSGSVIMNLSVAGPQGVNGSLTVTYNQWAAKAYASISGTLAGHTIAATMYAP